ncbi:uncharacterized protein LOC109850722 isoform X1 [Asparagus officinalis]|uniref:uncharacterized protein LOC109850722 isoform X1 n=2 Tax=Asparagus officinalis TaxID=4686 RepID=UPI00098E618A|nr:uncharacterized protein LOC109850722 isoform X1 [Asparagus officinalis]
MMAIVKRTARKRTLSFWGRDGHQIRLAFPYRKPSKLEYMTHKFKRNDKNLIAAFKDSLDLNHESTCQEYFTNEAESSKKKVHLDNVSLSVTCDNTEVKICSSDNITPCKRNLFESDVEQSVSVDLISPQMSSNKKEKLIKIEKDNY